MTPCQDLQNPTKKEEKGEEWRMKRRNKRKELRGERRGERGIGIGRNKEGDDNIKKSRRNKQINRNMNKKINGDG